MILEPDLYGCCDGCGVAFDAASWEDRHSVAPRDGLTDAENAERSEHEGAYHEDCCPLHGCVS